VKRPQSPAVACRVLADEAAARYGLPAAGCRVQLTPPEARHLAEAGAVEILEPWKAAR